MNKTHGKYIHTSLGSFPHHLLSTLDEEEDQESISYPSSHKKEATDGRSSSSRAVGATGREGRGEKEEEGEGSSSSANPLPFVSTSSLSSLPIPIPGLRSRVSSFENLASSYSSTSSIAPRLEEDDDEEEEEEENDPERQHSQHREPRGGEEEGIARRKTRQHGLGAEDGRGPEVDELTARLLAGPEWAQTVRELEYGGSGVEKASLTSLLTSQVESCRAEQRWYEANLALESLSAPHSNLWYVMRFRSPIVRRSTHTLRDIF